MNTHLNVRKPIVLTLAALAFLLAATVLLLNVLDTSEVYKVNTAKSQQNVLVDENDPQTISIRGNLQPNPRVKFAALDGRKPPAALDGWRTPSTLDGRKPPAALDGWRTPSTLDGRKPPAALDGWRTPSTLDGRKPPAALDGWRTPSTLDGRKPPAALAYLPAMQINSLALVDGLILLALAALLLAPARKTSALRS
jgi:hypothetical protein